MWNYEFNTVKVPFSSSYAYNGYHKHHQISCVSLALCELRGEHPGWLLQISYNSIYTSLAVSGRSICHHRLQQDICRLVDIRYSY